MENRMAALMATIMVSMKENSKFHDAEWDAVFSPLVREMGVKKWLWTDVTGQIDDFRWIYAKAYRAKVIPYLFWHDERQYLGLLATRDLPYAVEVVQKERERRLNTPDILKGEGQAMADLAFLEAQLTGLENASS